MLIYVHDMQLDITEKGEGRPVLILHGGGGPFTVAGIAEHVAQSIADLAGAYRDYLDENDLRDVLVIGSSLGGWTGMELALLTDRVSAVVLIDSVGVDVPGEPIRDFFGLDAKGVAEYSFHDGEKFYRDPATIPAEQAVVQRANMATMRCLAGDPYMHDLTLLGRLGGLAAETLVIWGESDRIVTPAYGAALAGAIPGARFEVIEKAGHLPQIEQPAATFALIDGLMG
jgi:pimeloyl-ACP methyl ester carboxylesterase